MKRNITYTEHEGRLYPDLEMPEQEKILIGRFGRKHKTYLKKCRKRIADYLREELRLEFSKSEIFHTKQGVDFCGYRDFKDYVLLRKSTAKRIRKRITKIDDLNDRTIGQLASAKGQLRHCCSYNFRKSIGLERRANGSFEWNN